MWRGQADRGNVGHRPATANTRVVATNHAIGRSAPWSSLAKCASRSATTAPSTPISQQRPELLRPEAVLACGLFLEDLDTEHATESIRRKQGRSSLTTNPC